MLPARIRMAYHVGMTDIREDDPSCRQPLKTQRLLLRPWRPEDREPFAALNADPDVRRYFGDLLTREQSDAAVDRLERHLAEHGFTFWAVEVPGVAPFIGFIGLIHTPFDASFTPAVEIGWRLARAHWGHGYATEGAREALRFGFDCLGLDEIVAFAVESNAPSRAVMERIGMTHDEAEDFDHPGLAEDHPFRRHVLYRARRD